MTLLNQFVTATDVRGRVVVGKVINQSNDGRMAFIRTDAHKPIYYVALSAQCKPITGAAYYTNDPGPQRSNP